MWLLFLWNMLQAYQFWILFALPLSGLKAYQGNPSFLRSRQVRRARLPVRFMAVLTRSSGVRVVSTWKVTCWTSEVYLVLLTKIHGCMQLVFEQPGALSSKIIIISYHSAFSMRILNMLLFEVSLRCQDVRVPLWPNGGFHRDASGCQEEMLVAGNVGVHPLEW